jgi:hypothetical protein
MSTIGKSNKVIKIIEKYCTRIDSNGKHYKAYPIGCKTVIIISKTPSDGNFSSMVYRDFRRLGIIINELKNV